LRAAGVPEVEPIVTKNPLPMYEFGNSRPNGGERPAQQCRGSNAATEEGAAGAECSQGWSEAEPLVASSHDDPKLPAGHGVDTPNVIVISACQSFIGVGNLGCRFLKPASAKSMYP